MLANLVLLGFVGLILAAAWSDMAGYRIPNWIPAALIALWPLAAFALGLSWGQIGLSLATFAGVLAIGMALWAPGFIGGGDAKLIAAAALWFGWPGVLSFLVWCVLCGGVLALALLLMRKAVPAMPVFKPEWVARTALADGAPAPYGIAIAAGAMIALPSTLIALV